MSNSWAGENSDNAGAGEKCKTADEGAADIFFHYIGFCLASNIHVYGELLMLNFYDGIRS